MKLPFLKGRKQESEPPMWLKELDYKDGRLQALYQSPMVPLIADMVAEFFEEQGGTNFVGFRAWHKKLGEFEVTVQRMQGLTPYQKYEQGLQRIAELEAEVTRLQSAPQGTGGVATTPTEDGRASQEPLAHTDNQNEG